MRAIRRVLASLLAAALLASGAAAEVLDSGAAGFTLRNVATVPVDRMQVWKALVDKVDAWWPKDHSWFGKQGRFSIEARAGGCFCEVAGNRQVMHMQIAFVDPGARLRMLGGLGPLQGMGLGGALDWILEPVDGGTRITLHYTAGGYTTEDLAQFAQIVDSVQALQLGGLVAYLAPAPAPR